jgi:hypothetical protein
MLRKTLLFVAVVAVGIAAATIVSGAPARESAKPLSVTSNIDGKRVLPQRSRWLAYPNVPAARVAKLEFLIDGKLRWVEHKPPYTYGGDDGHGHLGYLFTSWLIGGKHRFTVRVTVKGGKAASDVAVARVVPSPQPPTALAGEWVRTVNQQDLKKSGPLPPPAGVWHLVFDRAGAWHLDPLGSGLVNGYAVKANVIHVYAPIQMAPFVNGKGGISRFGHHSIGGTDCREDGPFGSYTWAVSGKHLTLTAIKEGCGNRRAVWEGTWTRVTG